MLCAFNRAIRVGGRAWKTLPLLSFSECWNGMTLARRRITTKRSPKALYSYTKSVLCSLLNEQCGIMVESQRLSLLIGEEDITLKSTFCLGCL